MSLTLAWLYFAGCFLLAYAADHPDVHPKSFCYDSPKCGPATWGGICQSGKSQSPIDIKLGVSETSYARCEDFLLNDHYLLERKHHFYAQNNGHTAQFELTQNTSALHSNLRLCGGALTDCYRFAQFHFHWDETNVDGSEHTINGGRFPMELHIVHYKDKYSSLAGALKSQEKDAVAVMAVFFKIHAYDNKRLNSILPALEEMRWPGKVMEFHLPLRVSEFYPDNKNFARYFGSLTTPTCDEKVVWTVFLTPIPISEFQMEKFRKLRNAEGVSDYNFRPLQPRNSRKISFFRTGDFSRILRY